MLCSITCRCKRQPLDDQSNWVLGKVTTRTLPVQDAELVSQHYSRPITAAPTFQRLQKNGEVFSCKEYKRVKCRNSYTVTYHTNFCSLSYGQILYFINLDRPSAVVNKFDILPVPLNVQSVISVQRSTTIEIVPIYNILEKCVFIEIDDTSYIIKLLTTLNFD